MRPDCAYEDEDNEGQYTMEPVMECCKCPYFYECNRMHDYGYTW